LELTPVDVRDASGIEHSIAGLTCGSNSGLIVTISPLAFLRRELIGRRSLIWHGYDLSALLFLAPLLSSRQQQNGSSRRNGRVGAAATKFKRRNVRSDDAVDRPLQSCSWPV
jgi:hypothetical protein